MEFKVFTLNCWGIPAVSSDRKARMKAIAQVLALSTYDVVCLQEVWSDEDYFLIKRKVSEALPYSHYFYSGYNGSGVCMFSKHAIVQTFYHKWMINGYVHKIHHGDWFGGKGIALCCIKFHDLNVNVYSTHLHAEYDRVHDEYLGCRVIQGYEAAQFIKVSSKGADFVVLAGDLNSEPGDLVFRLLMNIPNLQDSFDTDHNTQVSTCWSKKNTYTPTSFKCRDKDGPRIDYVLYRGGPNTIVEHTEYNLPLPDRVPGKTFSYSDHEAVCSHFLLSKGFAKSIEDVVAQKRDISEAMQLLAKGIKQSRWSRYFYWFWTVILFLLISMLFAVETPLETLINILRLLLTILACFMLIMATVWNRLELNAIYASKNSMEVYYQSLNS